MSKKKKSQPAKIVLPTILILIVTAVLALSYFDVIDLPFLNRETPTEPSSSPVSQTSGTTEKTTKAEETSSTETTEETTEETSVETTEETTEESTSAPVVTADEKESLRKTLSYIGSMYDFETFSASQKDAYEKLLRGIISPSGVCFIYNLYYGRTAEYFETTKDSFAEEEPDKRDPLDKFGTYYRYGRVKADNVDSIIKNVFGVEPKRSGAEIKENGVSVIYYNDGYYYFACEEGGSVGVTAKIVSLEENDDGSFTAVYEMTYDDDESTYIGRFKTECRKNGESWQIMSIKAA